MSAAFSIVALCALFRAVYDELGTAWRRRWFLYVGFFLCVEAYLHVHFTAEMAAGNLLVLLAARTLRLRHETPTAEFRTGILLGLLAGLPFAVRYQAGFALAGYGLWLLCYHRRGRLFAGMVPGVLLALAAGMLTDRWLYGEWTLVPYNYLRENILEAHMDEFGVSPWWFYFTEALCEGGYLFGALMLVAAGWFFVRRPKKSRDVDAPALYLRALPARAQGAALLLPGALLCPLPAAVVCRGPSAAALCGTGLALDGGGWSLL